jgi:hypothetical protein
MAKFDPLQRKPEAAGSMVVSACMFFIPLVIMSPRTEKSDKERLLAGTSQKAENRVYYNRMLKPEGRLKYG